MYLSNIYNNLIRKIKFLVNIRVNKTRDVNVVCRTDIFIKMCMPNV